nr:MAG TPA: hypothetical protein [Caudoviricetes sp.]
MYPFFSFLFTHVCVKKYQKKILIYFIHLFV